MYAILSHPVIFSKGLTDHGQTDLVEHTFNLEDDRPFKKPRWCTPHTFGGLWPFKEDV